MAYKLPIEDAKKESDRCWKVATETYDRAAALVVIKQKLGKTAEIGNIIAHLKDISSLLRDCTDLLLVFKNRIYLFDEYLDAALQSINHTNRVLIHLLGDEDFLYADTAESRWKYLLVKMENEVGVPLLNRVVIYQSFLAELVNLIEQPSKFEPVSLQAKIIRLLTLREKQGIANLYKLSPVPTGSNLKIKQTVKMQWGQKLFPYPKKKLVKLIQPSPFPSSQCFERRSWYSPDAANEIPLHSAILFRMSFDDNMLSVVVYVNPDYKDNARMWCRWRGSEAENFQSKFASRGLHELRVERRESGLVFQTYNDRKDKPEKWLALYFTHWEEMVLFHHAYAALKQMHPEKVECDPEELVLGSEKKLFRGIIIDDGLDYVFTLYRDNNCGGCRIATAVKRGDIKRSPVWTTFLGPYELKKDNVKKKTDRTVILSNVDKEVCSPGYNKKKQEVGHRSFKVKFQDKDEADDFIKAWKKLVKEYNIN